MSKQTTKNLLVLLYFLVLAIVVTWPAILMEKTFFAGDLKSIFQPSYKFLSDSLRSGIFPLWSGSIHSGFPIFAWSQGAFLYPPVTTLMLLFDSFVAFNLLVIIHIALAGFFTYLYTRQLGLERISAIIGGTSFGISSFLVSRIQHPNILMTIAWLPLALFWLEKFFWKPQKKYLIYIVITLSLTLLTGQPQYAVFLFLFFLVYYLFKVWCNRHHRTKDVKKFVVYLIIIFLLATGLASTQLLPLWELKNLSNRATGISSEGLYFGSLPPAQTLRFIWPKFFGWDSPDQNFANKYWGKEGSWLELNLYLGIIPLILAFISVFYRKRRKMILFFGAIIFVSILLAMGRYFPLSSLINKLPLLRSFSVPARWVYMAVFSLSILAAFGSHKLTKISRKQRNRIVYPLIIFFGLIFEFSFIYNYLVFNTKASSYRLLGLYQNYNQNILPDKLTSLENEKILEILKQSGPSLLVLHNLIIPLSFLVFFGLWYLKKKKIIDYTVFRLVLLAVLLLDLVSINLGYAKLQYIQDIEQGPTTASFIQNQTKGDLDMFRVFTPPDNEFILTHSRSDLLLGPGLSSIYDISNIDMVGALPEKYYDTLLDFLGARDNRVTSNLFQPFFLRNFRLLDILNTKYILHSGYLDPDFINKRKVFRLVFDQPDIKIYENLEVLPRAYLVSNYLVTDPDDHDTLRLLKDTSFDPRTQVMLEKKPKLDYTQNTEELESSLKILEYSNHSIKISATTNKPTLLVLSETHYPGWEASINNQKTEIYRANTVYKAIELPEGRHEIHFRFKPKSFSIGLLLSGLTLVLLFVIPINRNRKK